MALEEFPIIYSNETVTGAAQDELDLHDGQLFPVTGFTKATINDADNDGITTDADTDDDTGTTETWTINGVQKTLVEVAQYENSTLHLNDGTPVTVDVIVMLFDDHTYAISAASVTNSGEGEISSLDPSSLDYTKGVTLGTQSFNANGTEFNGVSDFQSVRDFFVCFTSGTLIATLNGDLPVEELSVGDKVLTLDNGYQEIRWIGSRTITPSQLVFNKKIRPVCISAGALGEGVPARNLVVSRQHRVFVCSKFAERILGTREALIPAIKLTEVDGVDLVEKCREVTYWHILFDQHEIILSEGCPSESLFTGPEALKAISPDARKEIQLLFPEISQPDYAPTHARPVPASGKAVREFLGQVIKNEKPLIESEVTIKPKREKVY